MYRTANLITGGLAVLLFTFLLVMLGLAVVHSHDEVSAGRPDLSEKTASFSANLVLAKSAPLSSDTAQ